MVPSNAENPWMSNLTTVEKDHGLTMRCEHSGSKIERANTNRLDAEAERTSLEMKN